LLSLIILWVRKNVVSLGRVEVLIVS
jgi:hypothetical protein